MHGQIRIRNSRREAQHRARLAECAPLLQKSIELGYPNVTDGLAIRRFYKAKHRRGEGGSFFGLHITQFDRNAMKS
jgi:hypothetical protein